MWNTGNLRAGEVFLGESQRQNEASVLRPRELTLARITLHESPQSGQEISLADTLAAAL